MYRGGPPSPRPESPTPPGIELSDLPPWSGDKTTVRSSGYTPPSLFALPSSRHPDHHLLVSSVTNGLPPTSTSPTTPTSPRQPGEPGQANQSDHADTAATPKSPASPQVDVITAQIHRALGVSESDEHEPHNARSSISPSTHWHDQEAGFRTLLGANTVDVDELRRLVWADGIPERPWMRDLAWKLLCGLLPRDRSDWETELAARRAEYWNFVSEFSIEPSVHAPPGDHPLCSESGSRWKEHFADVQLRESIVRDANRALPTVSSFVPLRGALARLLFVHSKTNPSSRYHQGMHELAAPFLSVFAGVPFVDVDDAEADAYFCYDYIMKEMSMMYYDSRRARNTRNDGLEVQLRELEALLRIKDPGLEKHLANIGVDPRFYGLRWLRLWLAHEFDYGDMLKIWDSLLTAEKALPWLRYVATAMLIRIRDELLEADFAGAMKLLLRYNKCDIAQLLQIADRLRTSNVVIVRSAAR